MSLDRIIKKTLAEALIVGVTVAAACSPASSLIPPANAAESHENSGLTAVIDSTPTPEPTYALAPTYTPEPTPTDTSMPIPDPLGLRANKFVPVTDASQVQDIVDYFQESLMGGKLIGREVPIKISDEDEFINAARIYVSQLDPKRQFAFGAWDTIINNVVIGYKIYILSGRPLFETVNRLCDEGAKAYAITNNPGILGPNYKDNLVAEASALPFQRACHFTLEEVGHDSFRVAKTRSNEQYILNTLLPFAFAQDNLFNEILPVSWAAADELGLVPVLQSQPNMKLSVEDEMGLYRHINSKPPSYWRARIRNSPIDLAPIEEIILPRLTPGIRHDEIGRFTITRREFYAP